MRRVRLVVEGCVLGPVAEGPDALARLLARHLGIEAPAAQRLVDRCTFGGEALELEVADAEALIAALDALDGPHRVLAEPASPR